MTTNDDRLRERLYSLRNCGRRRPGADLATWEPVQSGNYRMSEWQSAVLSGANWSACPSRSPSVRPTPTI